MTPLGDEEAVFLLHLQVRDEFRRHGAGRALVEATVSWAEEKGTSCVIAATSAASRDANRFMARLGLTQMAVLRGATVAALRAKLPVDPPAAARVDARSTRAAGQALVRRRSMRRAQRRAAG
jgi:GNAT superfamily N-acetyltransferase